MQGQGRVVIENLQPEIGGGEFYAKCGAGDDFLVEADIFCDGHDAICADLLWRFEGGREFHKVPMGMVGNDRWRGSFKCEAVGFYEYTITAWIDHFKSWQNDIKKKNAARQDIATDIIIGVEMIRTAAKEGSADGLIMLERLAGVLEKTKDPENATLIATNEELSGLMRKYGQRVSVTEYGKILKVLAERERAVFGSWYEVFARSTSPDAGRAGTLRDCIELLGDVAGMHFDVLYLAPIHPIGETSRKGKNNARTAGEGEPGSPWAIGSVEGGHKAIDPDIGTMEDFEELVREGQKLGIEIAMDVAIQCSPDHPYVKEHPEWFKWRPDGTIQFSENPPKKYEDIVPINFETENWRQLWDEIKSIFDFWIEKGVRIFRVDNPHTKSFAMWQWLIGEVKAANRDVIFLAEAFTRPKVMYRLAKIGFTQSYTYFTWRNTKSELTEYMRELTSGPVKYFFRPNFWPNTPDILPEYLQLDSRRGFIIRLVLAATLSSNYGIYGPAYELCVNNALDGKEEYGDSEKYEVKHWNKNQPGNLREIIKLVNLIRRENAALWQTNNIRFCNIENEYMLAYIKSTAAGDNIILTIVNLDPFHKRGGYIDLPIEEIGIDGRQPYLMRDMLSEDKYIWSGSRNYVELDPYVMGSHIFRLQKRLKREYDFDYYF